MSPKFGGKFFLFLNFWYLITAIFFVFGASQYRTISLVLFATALFGHVLASDGSPALIGSYTLVAAFVHFSVAGVLSFAGFENPLATRDASNAIPIDCNAYFNTADGEICNEDGYYGFIRALASFTIPMSAGGMLLAVTSSEGN